MAKLEALLTADINPFESKLKEAAEKAKEFGEGVREVGNDLFKGLSGFDIGAAIGIAGAITAAKTLGDALVDAVKEGYAEFQKFEAAVLRIKYALPAGAGRGAEAKEIAETAESKAGLFSAEQMLNAARIMMQASAKFAESPEKLNAVLDTIKDIAFAEGSTVESVAESYKNLLVGAKEGGAAGSRAIGSFLQANPALLAQAREYRETYTREHPKEVSERMRGMDISQFMATLASPERLGLQKMIGILEDMMKKAAPGAAREAERVDPGAILKARLAEISKAFGEQLKPAIDNLIKVLIAFLPTIRDLFTGLANVLKVVIPILTAVEAVLGALAMVVIGVISTLVSLADTLTGGIFSGLINSLNSAQEPITETGDKLKAFGNEVDSAGEKMAAAAENFSKNLEERVRQLKLPQPVEAVSQGQAISHADLIEPFINPLADAAHEVEKEWTIFKEATDDAADSTKALTAAQKEAEAMELDAFKEGKKAEEEDVRAIYAHAAAMNKIALEAAQFNLKAEAHAAARRAVIDRPRSGIESLDKQYAAQSEADAKSINIRAGAAEKINAANEEAADKISKIEEESSKRKIEREIEDKETAVKAEEIGRREDITGGEKDTLEKALQDEIDARTTARNNEDAASQQAINDAKDAASEKIREADVDAANQIIDAQEEAAEKIIDAQEEAALSAVDKMKGPFAMEEEPAQWAEFGKWGKHGYEESASERKEREKRNRAAEEANAEWKIREKLIIKREFEEKKRIVEDALEEQRPTQISLKHVHEIQQEEHVKAIEAEKGRTEADKEFAAQHAELGLPPEPGKKPTGKADISRKVLAEILVKIFDQQVTQIEDFEKVFMAT
jgi:hypothetical protein